MVHEVIVTPSTSVADKFKVYVPPADTLPVPEIVSIGASFIAVMFTIVLPVANKLPPLPCAPLLLSSMFQLICTFAGGVLLVLL